MTAVPISWSARKTDSSCLPRSTRTQVGPAGTPLSSQRNSPSLTRAGTLTMLLVGRPRPGQGGGGRSPKEEEAGGADQPIDGPALCHGAGGLVSLVEEADAGVAVGPPADFRGRGAALDDPQLDHFALVEGVL